MDYPISTNYRGEHVHKLVRCPVCETTNVKVTNTYKLPDGVKLRRYECRECKDLTTRKPTVFKKTVI